MNRARLEQKEQLKVYMSSRQVESLQVLAMSTQNLEKFISEEQMINPMLELPENGIEAEMAENTPSILLSQHQYNKERTDVSSLLENIPEKKSESLEDYLIAQLPVNELDSKQYKLCKKIIRYLDRDTGFLPEMTKTLLNEWNVDAEELESAIRLIRTLDPAGVCAYDMRDCFKLQLERRGVTDRIPYEIIDDYLKELAERKFSGISRHMKISTARVREAYVLIQSLSPHPTENFNGSETQYIVPDVIAEYENQVWVLRFLRPAAVMVRLNHEYIRLAKEAEDTETINYFANKIHRARQLAAAVQQREDTIKALLYYALEEQKEYALGNGAKRKLQQKTIAERLGVHPSTINRALKDKYIKVPIGIIPMKGLFSNRENTTVVESNQRLKEREKKVIEEVPSVDSKGKVSEICLIAPTEKMLELNQSVCRMYGKKVTACIASLPDAAQVVHKLQQRGAKIFISRKGTKKKIEEKCHVPVIDVGLNLSDYVPLMEQAARVKGKVAFFSYGLVPEDVRSMCYLMEIDALFYSFYKISQCDSIVRKAIHEGAVLGIGGANTAPPSEKYGLEHLIVENSPQSLLAAIESAEQMLHLQKEEAKKQEELKILLQRYDLALNFTHDAIFAVDQAGKIEVMNGAAEKIAECKRENAVGKTLWEIISDTRVKTVLQDGKRQLNSIMKHGNTTLLSNLVPIIVDGQIHGALAAYQDVHVLQKHEQKLRIQLSEKGLVAKYHFSDIIGDSTRMRSAVRMAEKFACSDATILLHGETGTGKELFAQSIHSASERAEGPFVAVNCGSLPKDILEAELFGYEEGAFTGASKGGKMGLFEMAHGGTIFLDEIGEMPLGTQVQLLRVLQEREIRRLGSDRVTPVNIRVIAATNRDLLKEIREGNFRQDLFFRINVLSIEIPPLRERREDIAPICEYLLEKLMPCGEEERQLIRSVLDMRKNYAWPGNVRQLSNLAERLYILCSQGEDREFIRNVLNIFSMETTQNLPEKMMEDDVATEQNVLKVEGKSSFHERERNKLLRVLNENNFAMNKSAQILEMNRSTLWRKMKKYGITKE